MSNIDKQNFDNVLEKRLEKIIDTLSEKGEEYSSDHNIFHTFDVAGRINREKPREALWGMAMKHLVSVIDIIHSDDDELDIQMIDEKFGDLINYLILAEIMIKEDYKLHSMMSEIFSFQDEI